MNWFRWLGILISLPLLVSCMIVEDSSSGLAGTYTGGATLTVTGDSGAKEGQMTWIIGDGPDVRGTWSVTYSSVAQSYNASGKVELTLEESTLSGTLSYLPNCDLDVTATLSGTQINGLATSSNNCATEQFIRFVLYQR